MIRGKKRFNRDTLKTSATSFILDNWKHIAVVFVGALFFLLLTSHTNILQGTDDAVLSNAMKNYTVSSWVTHQYGIWSGRVTAESLIVIIYHNHIIVWRILQMLMYVSFVWILYRYYALFRKKPDTKVDLLALGIIAVSPFLMTTGAMRWGAFWITGSLNYFWIATLGLIGIYPLFKRYLTGVNPSKTWIVAGMILSVLASLGQEQVYLVLSAASILLLIAIARKGRASLVYPIIHTGLIVVASAISYLAPGNKHRLAAETATYIPNFNSVSIVDKFNWSYRWFLDMVINHSGMLLPILWIVIILLVFSSRDLVKMRKVKAVVVLLVSASLLFTKIFAGLNIFNFYAAWGVPGFPRVSYLYAAYWTIILVATVYSLYLITSKQKTSKFILPTLFLAFLADVAALTLSPTMYASGDRVMLVPLTLLIVLLAMLWYRLLTDYWKYKSIFIIGLTIFSVAGYVYLLQILSPFVANLHL